MAGKTNTKLPEAAQVFVVQSLASFDAPSVVAAAVRKEFAVEITPQSIEAYDPTKRAGANISTKWRTLFDQTRKTFLEDTAAIGIANRSVRLRALHRMAERAEAAGNLGLAAQLHKQAAEEVGGSYTNRRELSGPNGAPIETSTHIDVSKLSDDQLAALAGIPIHNG